MVFWGFVHCDCLFGSSLGCLSHKTGLGIKFLYFGHLMRHFSINFACLVPETGREWFFRGLFIVIAFLGHVWDV